MDIGQWSLDECCVQKHNSRLGIVVPPEIEDLAWIHEPTSKSVSCFGAGILSISNFVQAMYNVFKARTVKAFLKKLLWYCLRCEYMVVSLEHIQRYHPILRTPIQRKYRSVMK